MRRYVQALMAQGGRWLARSAGVASSPQLPMVLKVPRLNTSPLALCDRPFSLLGFGDILVPGTETGHESRCPRTLRAPRAGGWRRRPAGGVRAVLARRAAGKAALWLRRPQGAAVPVLIMAAQMRLPGLPFPTTARIRPGLDRHPLHAAKSVQAHRLRLQHCAELAAWPSVK